VISPHGHIPVNGPQQLTQASWLSFRDRRFTGLIRFGGGKGCSRQLSFLGLGQPPARVLTIPGSGLRVIHAEPAKRSRKRLLARRRFAKRI
jgi:hypothetical protein